MINVRPARRAQTNRGSVAVGAQQTSNVMTFPSPREGLITTADLATTVSGAASVLENWFPSLTGARIRGGSVKRGLTSDGLEVQTAFTYKFAGIEKMFMATASGIFDMTSPAAPPTTTAPAVSGLTSAAWSTFQHVDASSTGYLIGVNGSDDRRIYNGTAWATTPAMTFTDTTTTSQLSAGWLFKNRHFYVKGGTMDAYYLPTSQIGGAAKVFPLGGVLKRGGGLLTGFAWSVESGNGLSETCCFVTTEGEVAVYSGSDPDSATDFALSGVFQIGRPLGKNAWIQTGGDIYIATVDGLVQMSQALQRDKQSLSLYSLSRPIDDDWRAAANSSATGWDLTLWPERNLMFVSFPYSPVLPDTTFVMNVQTGKWSVIRNWRARCYAAVQGSLFFGSNSGYVWQGDTGGMDDGAAFQATYLSTFRPVSTFGQRQTASLARMYFRSKTKPEVLLFARADYNRTLPTFSKPSTGDELSSEWDVGLWDVAKWDSFDLLEKREYRQNVRATGDMLAIGCAIVSTGAFALAIEIDLATVQATAGENSA